MATVGHPKYRSCRTSGANAFSATDNQSTVPIAAVLLDNTDIAYPDLKPMVAKSSATGQPLLGVFNNFDSGGDDTNVATGGIQAFRKATSTAAVDIGRGIVSEAGGNVDTAATGGIGIVVGRSTGTDNILWVDLG